MVTPKTFFYNISPIKKFAPAVSSNVGWGADNLSTQLRGHPYITYAITSKDLRPKIMRLRTPTVVAAHA